MAKNADLLRFTNEWLYQIAEIVPNFFIDTHTTFYTTRSYLDLRIR